MALYLGATRNLLANGKSLLQRGCPDRDSTAESSASAEAAAKNGVTAQSANKVSPHIDAARGNPGSIPVIAASSRMIYCNPANR
jgi:hypothetical protein